MFYLEGLQIEGFRNYQSQKIQFNPHLNVITGANAQGKTNLLESIFYLSITRSFRTNRDQELIHWEYGHFFIKGIFFCNEFKNIVNVGYKKQGSLKISINNNSIKRFEHMQKYPVVSFSPDDLQIIKEGPAIRRRFINLEASRLSSTYLYNLKSYQRVLLQRNKILKEVKDRAKLDRLIEPWDQSLVKVGLELIRERINIIKGLEERAQYFFAQMTSSTESLSLNYHSSVVFNDDSEKMEEAFYRNLIEMREQEMKRHFTLLGPHRDDIKILVNGYDARSFSSQGQIRTASLALKMAEISLFYDQNNIYPILLLDDVFSEFDESRKINLLNFIHNSVGQCFITSAVKQDRLLKGLNREYKMFTIFNGRIVDEGSRAYH
ncbi:MAG: DNA replication/repair protein RecF [Bacillota bacterium]